MSKNNNLIEFKDLEIKSLSGKILSAKKTLADLIMDRNMSKLKDLKSVKRLKKEIAQMLTIKNQKILIAKIEESMKGAK